MYIYTVGSVTCNAQRTQSWWQTCLIQSQQAQVAMAVRYGAHLSWLAGTCVTALYRGSSEAAVYKQALKVPRSTSNQLAYLEMGRYPMQIQWLQRTLSYWNKLVASQQSQQ